MQRSVILDIDSTLIGFRIEMLCEYTGIDGRTYLDWCHGQVTSVAGKNSKFAQIWWDESA
jgi:hypothetical protein